MPDPSPINQLWASPADLDDMGPPRETLATISIKRKLRALRAASGELLTYVRSRYQPPLAATIEEVSTGVYLDLAAEYDGEELDLPALSSGAIAVIGEPTEAVSIAIRATSAGAAAWLPVAWSLDGGFTWNARDVGTLDGSGQIDLGVPGAGLTVEFSGTIEEGAAIIIRAGVEEPLVRHAVALAAFALIYNRGVDPESPAGKLLLQRHDIAIEWAKDVQKETAKLAPERDATPNKHETRPRGGGQKNPWDWIDSGNGC